MNQQRGDLRSVDNFVVYVTCSVSSSFSPLLGHGRRRRPKKLFLFGPPSTPGLDVLGRWCGGKMEISIRRGSRELFFPDRANSALPRPTSFSPAVAQSCSSVGLSLGSLSRSLPVAVSFEEDGVDGRRHRRAQNSSTVDGAAIRRWLDRWSGRQKTRIDVGVCVHMRMGSAICMGLSVCRLTFHFDGVLSGLLDFFAYI